jgi:hypothetical protein
VEEDRPARPWDLLKIKRPRVDQDIADQRYDICKNCEYLTEVTRQCKQCNCFMKIKVTLPHAQCPLGKWNKEQPKETW